MKTKEFLDLLEDNRSKSLIFEYQTGKYVPANYHITEVKHVSIESVDCGGRTDDWKETVIQLWESPDERDNKEFMSVYKALGILKKVRKMQKFDLGSELRIEYSNDSFNTAQLYVDDFEIKDQNLTIKLQGKKTDCKAKETCGVKETKVVELIEEPCCSPDGNCC